MIQGGEDPRHIARRPTRFAAEDGGLADPRALPLAIAAWEAHERHGTAPTSNAAHIAWGEAEGFSGQDCFSGRLQRWAALRSERVKR